MRDIHILHHNDLDGYISAYLLKYKYPKSITYQCDYQGHCDIDKILKNICVNDIVYIVDYSLQPDKMQWLQLSCQLIWIDHHISAIQKSQKYKYDNIDGIRQVGRSGCELTYQYLYPGEKNKFIQMVGQFDTFRNSEDRTYFHQNVLPFFFGCEYYIEKLKPQNLTNKFYRNIIQQNLDKYLSIGNLIYKSRKKQYKRICESNSYVRQFHGYKVLCINSNTKGSLIFDLPNYFNSQLHDIMCVYNYNGQRWNYGLYTPKKQIDCSKIAILYGGGGHKGASGFSSNTLIQELK